MVEVTDITTSVAEGERIAPEEPLESYDTNGHHGKPDEGERRLATRETRVEEADSGNHEEH